MFITSSKASPDYFSPDVDRVFRMIYNYQLSSADSAINRGIAGNKADPIWTLLRANEAWTQIIAGNLESTEWNRVFLSSLVETQKYLKTADVKDPRINYAHILIHAFRTRYDMLKGNYLTAVSNMNACADHITASFGKEADFEPYYLTSGLYYYFMANAYENYFYLRPVLFAFPNGDKEKGLQYLKRISVHNNHFLKNEANYFLMRIYLDVEEEPDKALLYAKKLCEMHPDNLIYRYYVLDILKGMNHNEEWIKQRLVYLDRSRNNRQLSATQRRFFEELIEEG